VTGGGNGLGCEYCLQLAALGAKVVVNDLGGDIDGSGASNKQAEAVAEEIRKAGGEAIANGADITDYVQVQTMVEQAMAQWGALTYWLTMLGYSAILAKVITVQPRRQ